VIKGADIVNGLFETSKEEQMPIEIIYISGKGKITHRTIVVKEVQSEYIKAFCLIKQQPRIFKRSNILSAAKPRVRYKLNYA
jgi:predicted DNA-binding transcriptional regulator YafY